ncbi:MAG: hypothetical protein ACPLX7_02385 [Candidatus Kapaibacteriota bacterium]
MQKYWLKILLGLIFFGIISIMYVDNVIKINKLAKENLKLKENLVKFKEQNLILRKKINELESAKRVVGLAIQKYGMKFPEKPAIRFE